MEFRVASFRGGHHVMGGEIISELFASLEDLSWTDVRAEWHDSAHVGPQPTLNKAIEWRLIKRGWTPQVAVFDADQGTGKGLWTMDFRKEFREYDDQRIGLEVMFNHAEAMVWTASRLDLANEAQDVRPGARIDAGVIILASDELKKFSMHKMRDGMPVTKGGQQRDFKMDSAVGTYERLRTILPKVRNFVKVPLLLIPLYPRDGGLVGDLEIITLDTDKATVGGEGQGHMVPWSQLPVTRE